MKNPHLYTGKTLEKAIPPRPYALPDEKEWSGKRLLPTDNVIAESIAAYFPGDALVAAVEYARLLKRPLLVRGEPGCGKTRLAQAIAYELHGDDYRQHYFEWHIKSTTKVNEGLYQIDHLGRLRDIEVGKEDPKAAEKSKELTNYRTFGPLGKAFLNSAKGNPKPTVLLIDEIDKADLDFPNDLLLELDQKRFLVPETDEIIEANDSLIVIITSNDEKELPNAFLRRCVFHYIDFPIQTKLEEILRAKADEWKDKLGDGTPLPDELVNVIATKFLKLRELMKGWANTTKVPATSELLDWLKLIYTHWAKGQITFKKTEQGEDPILTLVHTPTQRVLFPEVLFKTVEDNQKFGNQSDGKGVS